MVLCAPVPVVCRGERIEFLIPLDLVALDQFLKGSGQLLPFFAALTFSVLLPALPPLPKLRLVQIVYGGVAFE